MFLSHPYKYHSLRTTDESFGGHFPYYFQPDRGQIVNLCCSIGSNERAGLEMELHVLIPLHLGQTPWPKLLEQCLIELAAGPPNPTQRAGGEN